LRKPGQRPTDRYSPTRVRVDFTALALVETDAEPMSQAVSVAVIGAPGALLTLITAAGCVARSAVDTSGVASLRWTTRGAGFARAEVRRRTRAGTSAMVALTNPVWFASDGDGVQP
jgi:hypothetical protein